MSDVSNALEALAIRIAALEDHAAKQLGFAPLIDATDAERVNAIDVAIASEPVITSAPIASEPAAAALAPTI